MANNVTLPATGDVIATEEISAREYQLIKVMHGPNGTASYASSTTPFPVTANVSSSTTLETTGVDANDDTEQTAALDVSEARRVGVQVVGTSGAHTTHVVEVRGSVDGTNYFAMSCEVTGEGVAEVESAVTSIVAKVKTEEGAASTVTVTLFAK